MQHSNCTMYQDMYLFILNLCTVQECRNAPMKVRVLMRECWFSEPICRPSFNSAVGRIIFLLSAIQQ